MITPMIIEKIKHHCSQRLIKDPRKEVPSLIETKRTFFGVKLKKDD